MFKLMLNLINVPCLITINTNVDSNSFFNGLENTQNNYSACIATSHKDCKLNELKTYFIT